MIVTVSGGRRFTDCAFAFEQLTRLHELHRFTLVVEGGQRTYDYKPALHISFPGKAGTKDMKRRAIAAGVPVVEVAP